MSRHEKPAESPSRRRDGTRPVQHGKQQPSQQPQGSEQRIEPQDRQRGQSTTAVGAGQQSVPLGFRLVSLAFLGIGVALELSGVVFVQGASAMSAYAGPISSSLTLVGIVLAGFGVGYLAAGYGTWTFRPWGRRLGLYISGVGVLSSLAVLVAGGPVGPVGLLVSGGMVWYLYANKQQYDRLRQRKA